MAKSKRKKLRRRNAQPFYEAMPLSLDTPVQPGYDWEAIAAVGSAAWSDTRRLVGWLRRLLWNRRARATYLALAATLTLTATVGGLAFAASTYTFYASDLASPAALLAKKQVGTTILDRNGTVLYEAYGAQHTALDALDTLPLSLRNATLAAEDPKFYSEPGVSWRGIARATVVDITHMGKVEGGSTLTQQLIKNSVLSDDKSFTRKFKEVVLATNLEQRYSKDEILQMYLNETYYGEGANGIEAAAQTYFHKPASQLDLSQSALLAGLPLGPSRLDPNTNPGDATDRRNFVLDRMATLGQITTAQAKVAKAEPVTVFAQSHDIKAPWFVFYILDQLKASYGETAVEQGGLTVTTTLDLSKEQTAENIVTGQINKLSSHNVTNGALVSLDPASGDILAMVGSANYNAPGWGAFNVITQGARQPGSSFKPFAYVTAFEKGWTGATTVIDAPVSFPLGDGQIYTPENYDLKFHGTVTLRHALDNSLNIPAIKVLQYAGINDTINTANALGASVNSSAANCGLSLVLGCAEVTPLDMATGYAAFDTGGAKVTPRAILNVVNRNGKTISKKLSTDSTTVLDPRYAYMMTNILADNHAREPEFPFNSPLRLTTDPSNSNSSEIPAAAKTGTTNDFRDNWTVGYTPGVVTAVWVGNSDNSPMENVDGITGAAPIWHDYMESVLAGQPVANFTVPAGISTATVCSDGGLANPWDSGTTEVFPTSEVPTAHCNTSAPVASPSPTPTNLSGLFGNLFGSTPTPSPSPTPVKRRTNPFGF